MLFLCGNALSFSCESEIFLIYKILSLYITIALALLLLRVRHSFICIHIKMFRESV